MNGIEERPARITDVAAVASVSIGTVSNVFNQPERVRVQVRLRVEAVADALGYIPNQAARELRLGRGPSQLARHGVAAETTL